MPITNDLLALYHRLFGPQAYSRATHTPVTFGSLLGNTEGRTDSFGPNENSIVINKNLRNLAPDASSMFFSPVIRHEDTHVIQNREPVTYNTDAVRGQLPILRTALQSFGYTKDELPDDDSVIREGLAFYHGRGHVPGLDPEQSEQFVRNALVGTKAGALRRFLGLH